MTTPWFDIKDTWNLKGYQPLESSKEQRWIPLYSGNIRECLEELMTKPDSQRTQTDSYRNQKEKNYVIWNKQNYTRRKIINWKTMWGRKDKLEGKKNEFEIHEIQTKNILMFVCLFLTPGSSLRKSATDSCLGYSSRSTEKAKQWKSWGAVVWRVKPQAVHNHTVSDFERSTVQYSWVAKLWGQTSCKHITHCQPLLCVASVEICTALCLSFLLGKAVIITAPTCGPAEWTLHTRIHAHTAYDQTSFALAVVGQEANTLRWHTQVQTCGHCDGKSRIS